MLEIGSHLGKYKILSRLGAGGMGEVFLAEDTKLERQVAIKVLSAELVRDAEFVGRFKQEAKVVSVLNHPNILTIHEIEQIDGHFFIVTEFIKGETLRKRLQRGSLELPEILDITLQLTAALKTAHSAGIIHRDIKPENIMIRDDGLVKILDFGLAKLTEQRSENVDLEAATRARLSTMPGMVMGTAAYMSPEQVRGKKVDSRSDIWNLGIVLYEMIDGKPPFDGETTSDVIAAILKTENEQLADLSREIPAALKRIFFKCLAKDCADRYQRAQDLQEDIRHLKKQIDNDEIKIQSSGVDSQSKPLDEQATQLFTARRTQNNPRFTDRFRRNKYLLGSVLGLVLILAGVAVYWFVAVHPHSSAIGNISQVESIAVMPFENTGGDAETEYLSDGITESLINSLSQIPGLTVKARSSVYRYKGKEIEPQKIGAELSVQSILVGRLSGRGDNLTINLELVEAQTGNHLWSDIYSRKFTDLVNLQSDIASDISGKLQKRLSSGERERVVKRHTNKPEAYQFYLKGRYYLNRRTPENFEKAIQNFQQAIELEPTYAMAYAGLSDCYTEMSYWSFGLPKETMPKARATAQKALEFDSELSEGYMSLARVAEDYDWNFTNAEQNYQRAIELNPNNAAAYDYYGGFLCEQKRFAEGLSKLDKAADLDPLSLGVEMSKGACLYQQRDYDKAIEQMQKIIKTDSNYLPAYSLLGAIYFRKGMYKETEEMWLKNSPLENYSAEDIKAWQQSFETGGIKGFLEKDIEFRKQAARIGRNQSLFIAMQYANLGDKEQSLAWLERAFEERHSWLGELEAEPAWDSLQDDPRFQSLLSRVGLKK